MKTFEVLYQAQGAATGKTVQMDVYKPDKTKDAAQSAVLTEIGTTGRYYGSFNADAIDWHVEIADDAGGRAVKLYDQATYDVVGVPLLLANVQTAVDNVAAAIGTLQDLTGVVDGKMDVVGADISTLITSVDTLATGLGVIEGKIDDLGAQAMIG